jgi:hypothetical protein
MKSMNETSLETLSPEELDAVAGAYWVWRNGKWFWLPEPRNTGVNNPNKQGDKAYRKRRR